jgi:Mlc titration factor MtfA (ptsG expression regulator)
MFSVIIAALAILGIGFVTFHISVRKKRRRAFLLSQEIPEEWREILRKDFPRYRALPDDVRKSLEGHIQVLMAEKHFEPCGSLDLVDPSMKLLISAQAALLLVRLRKHGFYRKLKSILVYPTAFHDSGRRRFDLSEEKDNSRVLGESWSTGSVILSWESVLAGARNADDGMNVTIHEFAHQLDQDDGVADGVPILRNKTAYQTWAKIFLRNYEELTKEVESGKGHRSLIDPYGATNPAEFFAVASETFYEEARQLKKEQPDLYGQLEAFYGVDPATWRAV